ncbi:MAG TPA: hypothetical protein PKC49_00435 [Phycisphaerae bacterium]|nr:hypothetical protein [Phycisphaerae bacterium]
MSLFEWFSQLGNGTQAIIIVFAAGAVIAIGCAAVEAWKRIRRAELRSGLTNRMLDEGMSADEIARVLTAAQLSGAETDEKARPNKLVDPEVRLVKVLTDNHYEPKDVSRILAAARVGGRVDDSTYGVVRSLATAWTSTGNIVEVLEARRDQHRTASDEPTLSS